MGYGKLSKNRRISYWWDHTATYRIDNVRKKILSSLGSLVSISARPVFNQKYLTNISGSFICDHKIIMQRDGALGGQQGNRWNSGTDPPLWSGTKPASCHWPGTKQVGKAREVDWSDSQKTCHYVHVCGDGKSSSACAWGFFFEQ